MSKEDREALAGRLVRVMDERFGGVAIRAYTAAGVNSATWTRATSGETIKPHTQRQIVKNLWPETLGDWTQIPDEEPRELDVAEQMREILRRQRALELQVEELRRARPDETA